VLSAVPNYLESYPTKMFEYIELGMPVIVSDFPHYRRLVAGHSCGLCVPPDDPSALAAAIEQLITHPDLARRYGENGRQAVIAEYRWESQLAELETLYAGEMAR
jgi:glycosyltransferase involved in cell wall biosynthesis